MTTIYLAWHVNARRTLELHREEEPVNLLVAYPELGSFLKHRDGLNIGRWVLDSGAFSAFNSGKVIDLADYIAACRELEGDAAEIFGLDVIGDAEETKRNLEAMWEAGVAAIPTFHQGSPASDLLWCAERAEKVALGGVARRGSQRIKWVQQCFSRVWPKKLHGFGLTSHEMLKAAPWHSVDASSWLYGPAWGIWAQYGHDAKHQHVGAQKDSKTDYWGEVKAYRQREAWARFLWRRELKKLEAA